MQYTTRSAIPIKHILEAGSVHPFTTTNTHFLIKSPGKGDKLHADYITVVNPTTDSEGYVAATIPVQLGVNTVHLQIADNDDLDNVNVSITNKASTTVMKIVDLDELEI